VWAAVWLLGDRAALGIGLSDAEAVPTEAAQTLARLTIVALTTFALSVAITRARRALIASVTEARLRANLSRYFSPSVVDELANAGDAARTFRLQKAAVLFADIRGFTAVAEVTPVAEVAQLLAEYRGLAANVINRHGGTIDKFVGDAVMAVFGVPHPSPRDAANAAQAGLKLLSAVEQWNVDRGDRGQPPVEVGVGVHYGDVLAGALGDEHRLEYTVIGDTVNTAERIERLTRTLGAPVLLSAEVLNAETAPSDSRHWEALPPQRLRGRSRPIQLYRLAAEETLGRSTAPERASQT